MKAHFFFI